MAGASAASSGGLGATGPGINFVFLEPAGATIGSGAARDFRTTVGAADATFSARARCGRPSPDSNTPMGSRA